MKKNLGKRAGALALLLISAMVLTACSGGKQEKGSNAGSAEELTLKYGFQWRILRSQY
jgi:hypothetical protein